MQLKNLGIIVLIAICFFPNFVDASSLGYRDIFVGSSARAVGMGSAFAAGPATDNAFLWNPSALGFINGLEFTFGGVPIRSSTSGRDGAFSIAASPIALGLTEKEIGNLSFATWVDGWGIPAFAEGTHDGEAGVLSSVPLPEVTQVMLLGYGFAFNEQMSVGANLRYYQNIDALRTNFLWSADVGLQWTYPLEERGDSVRIGVSLSELSSGIRADGVLIERAPIAARTGVTYSLGIDTLFSADLVHYAQSQLAQDERFRLHFGVERWFVNGHFAVRTGYTALMASERFGMGEWTRGLSLRNSMGQLDYAYVNGSELAQGLHWISATLRWGGGEPEIGAKPNRSSIAKMDDKTSSETGRFPILMPVTLEADAVEKGKLLQLSEHAISPNNDGVSDSTAFQFEVGNNDNWRLSIRDEYTEGVWEQSGTGSPSSEGIVWKGTATTGEVMIDGDYEVTLRVVPTQRGRTPMMDSATITVDVMPPTVELFEKKAPATVGIKTLDGDLIARWEFALLDADNNPIERMKGEGAPPEELVLTKAQQRPSVYTCQLSVHDRAGNRTVQQVTLQSQQVSGSFSLMVGSFTMLSNAERLTANLRRLCPQEHVEIHTVNFDEKVMHRVMIGSFTQRQEAEQLKQRIRESLEVESVLMSVQ